jgi:hypothetical protein
MLIEISWFNREKARPVFFQLGINRAVPLFTAADRCIPQRLEGPDQLSNDTSWCVRMMRPANSEASPTSDGNAGHKVHALRQSSAMASTAD